jgi:hypothetical protein
MFTHLTADQVDTVRRASRSIQGSFNWTHIDGTNGPLVEIAIAAIHEETAPIFCAIRDEVAELGYASCGLLAEALNAIIQIDVEMHAQADRVTTLARKEARRRAQGRCLCCNRVLTDPISLERGYGPECARLMDIAA